MIEQYKKQRVQIFTLTTDSASRLLDFCDVTGEDANRLAKFVNE